MAGKRQTFRVLLVLEHELKLRRSKRQGELVLDPATQSALIVYPRLRHFFRRKFEQPLKCVIGRRLLRVFSSNGSKSFMCRLLSEEDVDKCVETLRGFGVQIIHVGEAMVEPNGGCHSPVLQEEALVAGCEAALQVLREASQASTRAGILEYEHSAQIQEDTETIMRAMFNARAL